MGPPVKTKLFLFIAGTNYFIPCIVSEVIDKGGMREVNGEKWDWGEQDIRVSFVHEWRAQVFITDQAENY